jgi:phage baseplate assembly protein W
MKHLPVVFHHMMTGLHALLSQPLTAAILSFIMVVAVSVGVYEAGRTQVKQNRYWEGGDHDDRSDRSS